MGVNVRNMEKEANKRGWRWREAGWLILLAGLGLALWMRFHGFAFDDPFITYRAAKNLALGHGLVDFGGAGAVHLSAGVVVLAGAPLQRLRFRRQ